MKTPELTPYQQSLADYAKNSHYSFKPFAISLTLIALTYLFGFGYLSEVNGTLPSYLGGWLIFGTILLCAIQFLGAIVMAVLASALFFMKIALRESKNEPWDGETQKAAGSARPLAIGMAKNTSLLYGPSFLFKLIDRASELFLFVILVTANHPILALFFGSAVLLCYFGLRLARGQIWGCLVELDDPLDADPNLDIDDLIDKLVEPEGENRGSS